MKISLLKIAFKYKLQQRAHMKDQTGNVGLCFNLGNTFHFRIP